MNWVRYALEWIVEDAVKTTPKNGIWVEIGAGVGTGIACMARHLIDAKRDDIRLYCVDPFLGTGRCGEQTRVLTDPGPDGDWKLFVEMMCLHAPTELGRIHMLRLTSLEASQALRAQLIDLCIIDGNHTKEGVETDITAWTPLMRAGATIGFDDMTAGSDVEVAVMARFPTCERRGDPHSTGFQVDWPTARIVL